MTETRVSFYRARSLNKVTVGIELVTRSPNKRDNHDFFEPGRSSGEGQEEGGSDEEMVVELLSNSGSRESRRTQRNVSLTKMANPRQRQSMGKSLRPDPK
ncbi:hypothetical protein PsorP6_007835 [Peronosclerospora sorghi]|uniref:Uncharacterized protein n=1 Tax=Peronosclerospora sorghi TaxID=230839 RepID=A0ACC0WBD0_9STRA|nr:hypothetical protein PsorP6_007835 [Peronosclerospora sorghi]